MQDRFKTIKERTNIEEFCKQNLQPAQRPLNSFVCPNCHSGASDRINSDSAFHLKGNKFKCFSCNASGDILDLAGLIFNITDKEEQLHAVSNWANIDLDNFNFNGSTKAYTAKAVPIKKKTQTPQINIQTAEQKNNANEYINTMQQNIELKEPIQYLQARGYTLEQAKKLKIGYDPKIKRLVLPFRNVSYYIARDITNKQTPKYLKPTAEQVGAQPLDNAKILDTEQAIFITEGLFDAYTLELLNLPAIALAGTGTDLLLQVILNKPRKPVLLFSLDRDKAGEQATQQAIKKFKQHAIKCKAVEIPQEITGKDIDEMQKTSPDALKRFLSDFYSQILQEIQEQQEKTLQEQLKHYSIVDTFSLLTGIYDKSQCRAYIPTGFKNLDKAIGGGLPNGLTTLGAVSSTGKTTLILQIADNIASTGRPVLFITIEQSATELLAKSLSRLMMLQGNSATVTDILNIERRNQLDKTDFNAKLLKAANEYNHAIKPNMYIYECIHQPQAQDIENAALYLTGTCKKSPVIFVDYLQLIAPANDIDTDKRIVDKNVTALRQLARNIKSPVVVVSSIKRAGYDSAVTMDSYKESGSIEYSSDLLLGLQPNGLNNTNDTREITNAYKSFKTADKRICEIVVLKNRTGKLPKQPITLTLDAAHNLFTEQEKTKASNWL